MSQTSSGLWPSEVPRPTKSEAERRVYNALTKSLPEGWYAWHSLKLRTKTKGEFSEADFVIAAKFMTPEKVEIMRKDGGGLICAAIDKNDANKINLPFFTEIVENNKTLEKIDALRTK